MEISVTEAATLLGRSARAVRARITRGELKARLVGKSWQVDLDSLPLTEGQRRSFSQRVEQAGKILERALPSPLTTQRERRTHSVTSLQPFVAALALHKTATTAEADSPLQAIRGDLEQALLHLGAFAHEYDLRTRMGEGREARRCLAHAVTRLLLCGDDRRALDAAARIEADVLPAVGGLLRWLEKRTGSRQEHGPGGNR